MAKFNTPPTAQQEEQIIDFSAFVRKYKRYWWLFLLSLIACISLAFLYLRSAQRVYNVKSVVLISQDDNGNGLNRPSAVPMRLLPSKALVTMVKGMASMAAHAKPMRK